MSQKLYITEYEYEQLNWREQRNYSYCLECCLYYNTTILEHGCNHGVDGY